MRLGIFRDFWELHMARRVSMFPLAQGSFLQRSCLRKGHLSPKPGVFGSQVHQQLVKERLKAAVDTGNCCCVFLIGPCHLSKIRPCLQAANLLPVKLALINLW